MQTLTSAIEETIKVHAKYVRKICKKYNQSPQTKKTAINLIKKTVRSLEYVKNKNFYLAITSASIWIANKYHEKDTMSADFVLNVLCKERVKKFELLEFEIRILKNINFKIFKL